MIKEQEKTITSLPRIYKFGNYVFNVKREFAVGGSSLLGQVVTMLMDEMDKRNEKQNNDNAR